MTLPRSKLGVALLGLGDYSLEWLGPALRETKRCFLSGVITGHTQKAKQWASAYDLNRRNLYNYEDFDLIANNEDIDIVYVVTPPALHAEFVIRAANAGKHVICEKPMATTVLDCDRMIEACEAARVRLSIGYRLRFDPNYIEMERLAHEDQLGPFTKIWGAFSVVLSEEGFRTSKDLGGGPLLDTGIYPIHVACMAARGNPTTVLAREQPKLNAALFRDVEETISFSMDFPGDVKCEATASFNKNQNYFRMKGKQGWIHFEPAFSSQGIMCETSRGPLNFAPVNQQAALMDDFADCILTGRASSVPGELGRRDIRIITAIFESMHYGRRITILY